MYETYHKRGLDVIAVSNEPVATLRAFARRKGATFPVLSDPQGDLTGPCKVYYVPATLVLDAQGQVQGGLVGYGEDEFRKHVIGAIEKLLPPSPAKVE